MEMISNTLEFVALLALAAWLAAPSARMALERAKSRPDEPLRSQHSPDSFDDER